MLKAMRAAGVANFLPTCRLQLLVPGVGAMMTNSLLNKQVVRSKKAKTTSGLADCQSNSGTAGRGLPFGRSTKRCASGC